MVNGELSIFNGQWSMVIFSPLTIHHLKTFTIHNSNRHYILM